MINDVLPGVHVLVSAAVSGEAVWYQDKVGIRISGVRTGSWRLSGGWWRMFGGGGGARGRGLAGLHLVASLLGPGSDQALRHGGRWRQHGRVGTWSGHWHRHCSGLLLVLCCLLLLLSRLLEEGVVEKCFKINSVFGIALE